MEGRWLAAINVACWDPFLTGKKDVTPQAAGPAIKKPGPPVKRAGEAKVTVTEVTPASKGEGSRPSTQCRFSRILGCGGVHPPWRCPKFGELSVEQRQKMINENDLCPFCLLHFNGQMCFDCDRVRRLACEKQGCNRGHLVWLHEVLTDAQVTVNIATH